MHASTIKQFVQHPIATTFPNWTQKLIERREKKKQTALVVNESRRTFLKFGATAIASITVITLLTKCGSGITGPANDGYTAVTLNGQTEFTGAVGTAITADQVTLRVTAITTPTFPSEPREATVEILNSDATAAYTTRMRKGEVTSEFYSPQDGAKAYLYKLECTEIPDPTSNPDFAKFTLWKKKA